MNQENLKKLIAEIEERKGAFNMGNPATCLFGYAKKVLGINDGDGVGTLANFLDIKRDQAANLYTGRRINSGKTLVTYEWLSQKNEESQRRTMLRYLKSFVRK